MKYERDHVQQTLRAMKRVEEIKERRKEDHYKRRYFAPTYAHRNCFFELPPLFLTLDFALPCSWFRSCFALYYATPEWLCHRRTITKTVCEKWRRTSSSSSLLPLLSLLSCLYRKSKPRLQCKQPVQPRRQENLPPHQRTIWKIKQQRMQQLFKLSSKLATNNTNALLYN